MVMVMTTTVVLAVAALVGVIIMKIMMMTYDNINIILLYNRLHLFLVL